LRRWLHFYGRFPPGFGIVIADSSAPEVAAENARLVATAQAQGLAVEHRPLNLDFMSKCLVALEQTESPWVTLCADDDFLFPEAVKQCADFLERQPGYVSAQGSTALLYPERRRFGCMRLKGFNVEESVPYERCRRLAGNFFSNFYSVYRREELTRNFRLATANTDSRLTYTLPEMLLSQLSALQGRIKVLPGMHLLMERHPTNAGYLGRTGVRPQAEALYQRFRYCLVTELVATGLPSTTAEHYVDETFGYFREPSLKHRSRRRSPGDKVAHLVRSVTERVQDAFYPDQVRHRRLIRRSDYAGSEAIWAAAVKLMRTYPDGIPAGVAIP
jgi:glycosyltransferase domain-containing protein